MNKFLLSTCLLFGVVACTSTTPTPAPNPVQDVVCPLETTVTTAIVPPLAQSLSCANQAQMTADIQKALNVGNFCPVATAQQNLNLHYKAGKLPVKGPIANVACPVVVDAVIGLVGSKLPASWQCTASTSPSAATISTLITGYCEKISL
jgi:hypothetical protein